MTYKTIPYLKNKVIKAVDETEEYQERLIDAIVLHRLVWHTEIYNKSKF